MSATPGIPIGIPVAPARFQFRLVNNDDKVPKPGKAPAKTTVESLTNKAIPAEARIPHLIRGDDGQVFIVESKPQDKKETTCLSCFDCCPDTDIEFPLRTVVCCTLWVDLLAVVSLLLIMGYTYELGGDVPEKHEIRSDIDPDYPDKRSRWILNHCTAHCANNNHHYQVFSMLAIYWWVWIPYGILFLLTMSSYCGVTLQCCGGGTKKTGPQKYSLFQKSAISNAVKSLGELIIWIRAMMINGVWGGGNTEHVGRKWGYPCDESFHRWQIGSLGFIEDIVIYLMLAFWIWRVYCVLAGFKLVGPRPAEVEKAPLVINVIQPEADQ